MARVTVGLVFHADCDEVDELIENLRKNFDIELIHVQRSYTGKLWITKEEVDQ